MITTQVHGSEPVQLPKVLVRQDNPLQHAVDSEHAWPLAEQVEPVWQVPEVEPVGTSQRRPVQQSAEEVQTEFCG